jgi:putative transposase
LVAFAEKWDAKYPMISRSWRTRWPEIVPFLKFPEAIRKVIYTTNAIESVNYTIRKITRNRQSFPTTDAALKLIYMALQDISKKWTMPLRDWGSALNQFAIIYGTRVSL